MEESNRKSKKMLLIIVAVVLALGLAVLLFADGGSLFQGRMKFFKNVTIDKIKIKDIQDANVGSGLGGGDVMMEEEDEPLHATPTPASSSSSIMDGASAAMEEEDEPLLTIPAGF